MTHPTLERILDCAHGLLAMHGYSGFSYADVARLAAIGKATVHHHFPAKTDLAVAVVQRYRARAGALLGAASLAAPSGRARLEAYVAYWRDCIRAQEAPFCVCALLAAEMPSLPQPLQAEVTAHFRALQSWLAGAVRLGIADGSLRPVAASERLGAELMASVHGAMLSARALDDPGVFDMLSARMLVAMTEIRP